MQGIVMCKFRKFGLQKF